MDRVLTEKIRSMVLNYGVDLIGFAPVERWAEAPFLISPKAILPTAKTVIVGATHITDTWTERGGEPGPQDRSAGGWIAHNEFHDRIEFRVARLLQDEGHSAIGIAASRIWRFRKYKDIPSVFAPDLSLIHAACAAGLGEIGWSGLAITPEYGSRVRFMAVVTDAELEPTPMYDGPALCDRCGECIRHCPSFALKKDFNSSKPNTCVIGGKTFTYCNKNIWRCAWAEHFGLDLTSKTLEKDHIDEKIILEELRAHGRKGHERGVCQKFCVPPHLRSTAPSFGRRDMQITQNRVNRRYPDSMPTLRKIRDDIFARAANYGVTLTSCAPLTGDSDTRKLVDSDAPGMKTVLGFAFQAPPNLYDKVAMTESDIQTQYYLKMHFAALPLVRELEDCGYHAVCYTMLNGPTDGKVASDDYFKLLRPLAEMAGLGKIDGDGYLVTPEYAKDVIACCIVTDAPLDAWTGEGTAVPPRPLLKAEAMRKRLEDIARTNLVTSFGVTPASRLDALVPQLEKIIDLDEAGETIVDSNPSFVHGEYIPEIRRKKVAVRKPSDYLPGAKNVILIGMHYQNELLKNIGLEKTQQIGTYCFQQYQIQFELRYAAIEIGAEIQARGGHFAISSDLLNISSKVYSPRGELADARANALEACSAGLGEIGESGVLLTKEHGPHQQYLAIVTDIDLPVDEVKPQNILCKHCGACAEHCPVHAIERRFANVDIDGVSVAFPLIPRHRCEWAKRYGLTPEEGAGLLGQTTNVPIPEGKISIEMVAEGCARKDPIMKRYGATSEPCLRFCPTGDDGEERIPREE